MPIPKPAVDEDLHDRLVAVVRRDGPTDVATLTRRVRLAAGHSRPTEAAVLAVLDSATLLVHRPDGRVAWIGDVLDGIVLTHRVRGALKDRCDLWLGQSVQPFLAMAALAPLPLAGGGEARIADTLDPVLIGPRGWLPHAEAGDLIGLTWTSGRLSVGVVSPDEVAGPTEELTVRSLLGERCHTELWWEARDEDWVRHALLIRALANVRLEDPHFLSTPHAPLDQLLYDPLGPDSRAHWHDLAAWRPEGAVSFAIAGMPMALDRELRHRAERYGMTLDQFVVAILGHLAWRTPFAEDIGPWEDWVPEDARPREQRVVHLRPVTDDPTAGGTTA